MIARLLRWLLPEWARPDHPLIQYELSHHRTGHSRRAFFFQLAALLLLLAGAAVAYAVATGLPLAGSNVSAVVWQSLYFPTLALQLISFILALSLGAGSVEGERSRKTWDNLRVTEAGAGQALRARWLGILYKLRAPIAAIALVRLLFLVGALAEMTAFGGLYVEMLGAQARPPLPDPRLGLLHITLTMTVSLLQPLVAIALAAVTGILLTVSIRERIYTVLIQLIIVAVKLVFVAAAALAIASIFRGDAEVSTDVEYLLLLAYTGFGDWALMLAQLGSLGEIWQRLPHGSNISFALAALLFLFGIGADAMMRLAESLAEIRG